MSGKNGQPYGLIVPSTVLKTLTEIQMVAADIISVTTCVDNATFYEPALQGHLTANAVYKRKVSVKVSAQSNTAGTISIQLYDVTTSAQLTVITVVIAGGQENVEKVIAATNTNQSVTNLSDVVTIRVKHSVNGATVTLNKGGIMEADIVVDLATNTNTPIVTGLLSGWLSSWQYMSLAGLTTATVTIQPAILGQLGGTVTIGSFSSTLNTKINVGLTTKFYPNGGSAYLILTSSGISSQILLGQAGGISGDNI